MRIKIKDIKNQKKPRISRGRRIINIPKQSQMKVKVKNFQVQKRNIVRKTFSKRMKMIHIRAKMKQIRKETRKRKIMKKNSHIIINRLRNQSQSMEVRNRMKRTIRNNVNKRQSMGITWRIKMMILIIRKDIRG